MVQNHLELSEQALNLGLRSTWKVYGAGVSAGVSVSVRNKWLC